MKEGNVVLLVPADLEQQLDFDELRRRDALLAPQFGYSLESLIKAVRPASWADRWMDSLVAWMKFGERC